MSDKPNHGVSRREDVLNEAARAVTVENSYDPNYATTEDRIAMETKLFLARMEAFKTVADLIEAEIINSWKQKWGESSTPVATCTHGVPLKLSRCSQCENLWGENDRAMDFETKMRVALINAKSTLLGRIPYVTHDEPVKNVIAQIDEALNLCGKAKPDGT